MKTRKRNKGLTKNFTRRRFDDNLPGVTAVGAFVKRWHRWRNYKFGVLREKGMSRLDLSESSFFGFVSDREEGKIGIRWKLLLVTFLEEIFCKLKIISAKGGFDDGVFGLKSLDDYFGMIEMATANAADYLGEEFESTFFSRKVRQRKTGIGLDDADASEERKIESTSKSLGTNQKIDLAGFDFLIKVGKTVRVFVVTIKTSNLGFWKKAS